MRPFVFLLHKKFLYMTLLQAIIIAIIEGITEFLPISSTGHMVVTNALFGIAEDDFVKLYTVCIQLGAILAVVVLYWKKFFDLKRINFYVKLIVAVIPALIVGFLFNDWIDEVLENPLFIGFAFLIGGIVLLFIEGFFRKVRIVREEDIDTITALKIGLFQVLAVVFPGVSRSAATIIGGLSQKLNKEVATEFSFFLAVPTMCAATGYKLLKAMLKTPEMLSSHWDLLLIGNVIAFIVAIIAIKALIQVVSKYGFQGFGIYRIVTGIVVIVLCLTKIIH